MPRIDLTFCNRRCWSVLLTLTAFAFLHNWTTKINTSAYVISSYEEDAISMFRVLVQDLATKDYMKSEGYLLRWLRYADFDVEKAYKAFTDSIKWRKKNNMDLILEEGYSSYEKDYPYSINGFDREGRPLQFVPFGTHDLRKIALSGKQHKYERNVCRSLELGETYLQEIRDQIGFDNITQFVGIIDLAGFNLRQSACLKCLKLFPDFLAYFEPNYPNIYHKLFVINAPSISYSAIQLTKHFMSEETKEALQVFDHNKDKWSKALLEQISPENLPIKYGGIKPNFDKASYATRNAAVIHLLGNAQHLSRKTSLNKVSTVNYNDEKHNTTTAIVNSNHPNYDYEHTFEKGTTVAIKELWNPMEHNYNPTSWFDSATSFDWTVPHNKMSESNSNQLGLPKTAIKMEEEKEILPKNHKQKHHHHYRKITLSDNSDISSAGTSTISDYASSAVGKNSNNIITGNYVLMFLFLANFLIFVY